MLLGRHLIARLGSVRVVRVGQASDCSPVCIQGSVLFVDACVYLFSSWDFVALGACCAYEAANGTGTSCDSAIDTTFSADVTKPFF